MLIPLLKQTLQPPRPDQCSDRSLKVRERHRVDIVMEALASQSLRVPHYVVSFPHSTGDV